MGAAAIIALFLATFGGGLTMRKIDQEQRNRKRVTNLIGGLPSDYDFKQATLQMESLAGTLRAIPTPWKGDNSIVFELWSTAQGIQHYIRTPYRHAAYVAAQLQRQGLRLEDVEDRPHRKWTYAVELRLTNSGQPLRITDGADVSHRILSAAQAELGENEVTMVQLVANFRPPRTPPSRTGAKSQRSTASMLLSGTEASKDEVAGLRKKAAEANVMVTMRLATVAGTLTKAEHLAQNVRHAFASVLAPHMRFIRRLASRAAMQRRIDQGSSSLHYGTHLTASELAAWIAWPVGDPLIPNVTGKVARRLPAAASIPREGFVLGTSNMPGNERDIAIAEEDIVKHVYCIGPPGRGKTTFLANLARQAIERNNGVFIIDGKGDLFNYILDIIPSDKIKDCIVVDLSDLVRPIGLNILEQLGGAAGVDEFSALVASIYKDASSITAPQTIYNMGHALAAAGLTFVDLPAMMSPQGMDEERWRDGVIDQVTNKDVRQYFQRFTNLDRREQDRLSAPVFNRIWQFTSRPEIKSVFGQRQSSFLMTDAIRDNKIVLVYLNGIHVGQQTASLAGTLILDTIWHAARTTKGPKPNLLLMDEFQDFTNLPISLEDMLAKSRSAGLANVLAHQFTNQLPPSLRTAALSNTGTKVIFQTTNDDARLMSRELGRRLTDADIQGLGRHEAIAMVSTGDGTSPPATMITKPPGESTRNARRVLDHSRITYGRPIADVQADFDNRYNAQPRRRPPIDDTEWE